VLQILGRANVQTGTKDEPYGLPGDYADIVMLPRCTNSDLKAKLSDIFSSIAQDVVALAYEKIQSEVTLTRPSSTRANQVLPLEQFHVMHPYEQNPRFTGRLKELKAISTCLDPDPTAKELRQMALVGIGGAGKTQTALEYVFSRLDKFPIILWAHADTRAKLNTSFARFAVELGLVNSATEVDFQLVREQVKSDLESRGETKLIFLRFCWLS
jgi:hypothetical protein